MQATRSISIVICCYNSEPRLPRVLEAIAKQKKCPAYKWEVIVVNNNSTDNTRSVAMDIFSSPVFSCISCKVVDELEPGLTSAREKGFRESAYDYVLFCDDDNIMAENFVANAFELIQEFPEVEIFGSWCEGEFEIPPPGWSKNMLSNLAIGRPAQNSGFLTSPVNGACMLVKKSSYKDLKNKSFQFLLSGRKGEVLTSGEDSEFCYVILLSGGSIYFSEKLFFTHLIPAVRLKKYYFKKLYMIPAKQDYIGVMYQWVLKNKETSFGRFYLFLLYNYCKTIAYCIKQLLFTDDIFYYKLLFRQRLRFLLYSLFNSTKIKISYCKIIAFYKNL